MRVNNEVQGSKHFLERIKLLVLTMLLVAAVVGNYHYRYVSFTLRTIAICFVISISCIIALMTNRGRSTVTFAREARTEVRKVIWPTFQETFNTTLIVIAVTTVMSITLWVLDSIMVYVVSYITSLRF